MSDGRERSVARRAGVVATGTLLSRILGAVRDAVIAAVFAVHATDAFFVAFTIPNALRVLLGEGAVSGAFVPVFSEAREQGGLARARRFFADLAGTMLLVLALVTVLGVVAAPWLVTLYAGGYRADPSKFALTVTLTRIIFPYIFLMGLAAIAVGALNSLKRFLVPAFAPALLNVSLIAAALLLVSPAAAWGLPGIAVLALGALGGGALQVLVQLPALRRASLPLTPRPRWRDPYVRKTFRLMLPLLAGLGVYQVNVMLSRLFASFLADGAQSFLYYGQRLVEIPQGMFALAIATASLPTLSDHRQRGEYDEVKRLFRYGLRLALFVAIPSSVALAVLAEPTVAVIFGRGNFGTGHVAETARSLVWLALGIWAVASVRTIVPVFHAFNDTRTPVLASALNVVSFAVLSLALMHPMAHAGIAAAMSAGAAIQLITLLTLLRRKTGPLGLGEIGRGVVRIAVASGAMGLVVAWSATFGRWDRGGNEPLNIVLYAGIVLVGLVVYLCVARVLGAPEVSSLRSALRRRGT